MIEEFTSDDKELLSDLYELIYTSGYELKFHSNGVSIGKVNSSKNYLSLNSIGRHRHYQVHDIMDAFDIEIGYNEALSALEDQGSVADAIWEITQIRNSGAV